MQNESDAAARCAQQTDRFGSIAVLASDLAADSGSDASLGWSQAERSLPDMRSACSWGPLGASGRVFFLGSPNPFLARKLF